MANVTRRYRCTFFHFCLDSQPDYSITVMNTGKVLVEVEARLKESDDSEQCDQSLSRACHFLKALLVVTEVTISGLESASEADCARKFRGRTSMGLHVEKKTWK